MRGKAINQLMLMSRRQHRLAHVIVEPDRRVAYHFIIVRVTLTHLPQGLLFLRSQTFLCQRLTHVPLNIGTIVESLRPDKIFVIGKPLFLWRNRLPTGETRNTPLRLFWLLRLAGRRAPLHRPLAPVLRSL